MLIVSFIILLYLLPQKVYAQSCSGLYEMGNLSTTCNIPGCNPQTDLGCSCTTSCVASGVLRDCSPLNAISCEACKGGGGECCDGMANCSWGGAVATPTPACWSGNCFTGACESGNGCQCWGVCSGSTCRRTSQVDPSCGSTPPTATPTTGSSCTYGSCSTAGATAPSSDPTGQYVCDGTCWQWVSFAPTPTTGSGGSVPTPTTDPGGGGGCFVCGGGGCCPSCASCIPLAGATGGLFCDWSTCSGGGGEPACGANGTFCIDNGSCCSGYCGGTFCDNVPTCSGCSFWNGSFCQDNSALCGGGQVCIGGVCQALTYTISGNVFIDANSNGVQNCSGSCNNGVGDELNYQGAAVLISPGGSQVTNSSGSYSRSNLIANTYTVTLTLPSGYTATTANPVNRTLGPNQTANFGIVQAIADCPTGLIASTNLVNPGGIVNLSVSGCTGVEDPPNVNPPPPFDWDPPQDDNPADEGDPQCSDGIDNDGDGKIDTNDPRCHWDGDSDNPGSYDPDDDNESPIDSPNPQCSDGIDNDGDGYTDIADPECHTDGNPDSDGDDVPDNNDGSYDPGADNESDRIAPNESGSTTCSDAGLNVTSSTSTSSNSTWTAQVCPAFQQVCTVTSVASGAGGSDTNTTNITVRQAGTINVDIRDVSDGSACDASAPLLTDEATIGLTGGITTTETITDGTYSFTCLPNGNYNVNLGLPPGYQMFAGTTQETTSITDGIKTRNIRFCVSNFEPWFQTTSGDVRMRGIVNPIPAGFVGSTDTTYPTVFFSSSFTADVEAGGALSQKNWLVDREYDYNSLTRNRNGVVAYSFYKNRARQEGIEITPLASATLNSGEIVESGVYEYQGTLTIDSYSQIPDRAVILVNGDVIVNTEIEIPEGQLFILAASGNITIADTVGHASPGFNTTESNLEGIYSAQGDIFLQGDECGGGVPDRRLNVEGALIANAQKPFASDGGGTIQNQRSLCSGDNNYPSLYVSTRADFLTKLTDFYKVSYTKWREVRP